VRKSVTALIGVIVAFCFGRSAELMWSHESTWIWWGGAFYASVADHGVPLAIR